MFLVQKEVFNGPSDPRLRSLNVVTDKNGLLRVKTRAIYSQDTEDFKYPVILPGDHPAVVNLIIHKHKNLMHCGNQILLARLREKYWILKGRKSIRKICVRCRRFSSRSVKMNLPPLPEDRVRDASVFEVFGVDLAGPLFLRDGSKAWIALFTCAVYRGIHLELLSSMTTESFLLALRRCIARRGRPSVVYSDNGTNFVGAQRILHHGYVSEVSHNTGLSHKKNPVILLKKLDINSKRLRIGEVFSSPSETLDSTHISASEHHASSKEMHYLIPAARRSVCFYCYKRTKNKCQNCGKYFCDVRRTGRECFSAYHEAFTRKDEEKFADDEMSSDEIDLDIYHSFSNCTNTVQVLDEVSPSNFKTPDSRNVSKVSSSHFETPDSTHVSKASSSHFETPDSTHVSKVYPSEILDSSRISPPGHHTSLKGHFLILAARRSLCFYCKKRIKSICPNCNKYFCNASRTGRDCFNLYHKAEKLADIEIDADELDEAIAQSISNSSDALQVSDGDDSDIEIMSEIQQGQSVTEINHTPVFVRDRKVCFYCKTEGSNWRCKSCGKSLCNQKIGKTCFHMFHSSPEQNFCKPSAYPVEHQQVLFPLGGYVSEVSHNMKLRRIKDPYILLKELDLTGSKRKKQNDNQVSKVSALSVHQKKELNKNEYSKEIGTEALLEDSDVQDKMEHVHERSISRRKCLNCKLKGIKSLTYWHCKVCAKHLCNQKTGITCFQIVHSLPSKTTHV
ncbi:unnamed protein product [Larinioides sclopetarius]|uniref:Integrase catalytic domain-containing protein n=1 Tax=Larinioides sclopetarius TaxID=280406 RepID=A0AAV2B7G5_9ARAC